MKVNKLKLINFRNYDELNISFQEGINLLYGRNASGKTNIVEAISLLSIGKSFRTNDDQLMIKDGCEVGFVGMNFFKRDNQDLKMSISKEGKIITYDGNKLERLSSLSGIFIALTFIPEDVLLFKDSPSVRRRFLDICLSSLYRRYIKELVEYRNVLKLRNALLKNDKVDQLLIKTYDEKMVSNQHLIMQYRGRVLKKLEIKTQKIFNLINNQENQIEIEYINDFDQNLEFDDFKKKVLEQYSLSFNQDLKRKSTSLGIHKDDFKLYLNQKEVSEFASQGQNRLLALSLKLAYGEIVKELTNDDPVIILDDVLSELDQVHQEKLLKCLRKYEQVFITSAKEENIENIHKYQVIDKMVIRRN